jgi:hypothetical protein
MNKNSNSFWNTWKHKVCATSDVLPCIDGSYDDSVNCEKFKNYFASICIPNSNAYDQKMKQAFALKLESYLKEQYNCDINSDCFNAEIIKLSIEKLHIGKAAGLDNLQTEHLTNAHPILHMVLAKLFYLMLQSEFVPRSFGRGLLVPIPKESGKKGIMSVDQFRGITISPVISKAFENCVLILYKSHFETSERQFGYKSKVGCTSAIFTVRKVIDHFVDNDSTVNVCCLDISKAFDRINHHALYVKLINRGFPLKLILLLKDWYSHSFCCVRWGNAVSDLFIMSAGVRQGGVLSAHLFNIYVDNILTRLDNSGCVMAGLNLGSFMYADDLILLSPSISELQVMVNICCAELECLDLKLNVSKSSCIRIGKQWHSAPSPINANNDLIEWASDILYLGVTILAAKKFSCCHNRSKSKFYSSFNAIYGKLGKIGDPFVTLNLISNIALPCLLYAQEALPLLTKSSAKIIEHPWSMVFARLFGSFDHKIVTQCQFYSNYLPVEHLINIRKSRFLQSLKLSPCSILRTLYEISAADELSHLADAYSISMHDFCFNSQDAINNHFVTYVNSIA